MTNIKARFSIFLPVMENMDKKIPLGGKRKKSGFKVHISIKRCACGGCTVKTDGGNQDRSIIFTALFYNGIHTLFILPLVLLVQLSCLTVGWTVGVWFIKQRLCRLINVNVNSLSTTNLTYFSNPISYLITILQ